MSKDNNQQPPKTTPLKKTSAVPLRKETVRVTLKAPGARPGAPAPPMANVKPAKTPTVKLGEVAQAPKSSTPPPAPTIALGGMVRPPTPVKVPTALKKTDNVQTQVILPDVTSAVPLKKETMRVTLKANKSGAPAMPAPAPTIPLGNAIPRPAMSAPTVPLNTGGAGATVPLATQPLQKAGSSQPLPKATVQLQQTQQLTQGLGTPSQAATIQTVSDDDVESRRGSGIALPLSIVAFVLSLVVFYFGFQHSKVWLGEDGEFMDIFDPVEGE